jgi:MFS transporter, ENTS family, enterobactin (siderophore) exporter
VTDIETTAGGAAPAMSVPGAPEATRNPFATTAYRWYWAAVVCGAMGVGIQVVTVPLFIRDRVGGGDRELIIAMALIAQTVPAACLMLVGGVAADRLQRQRIMTRVWLAGSAVSVIYVALSGADVSVIWPVFILGAVIGSLDAFGQPARFSMPPQILPQSQVQNGIILNTVAFMAAFQFLGPSIGGLLADFANLTVAFGAEVVFLLTGALLATRVHVPAPVPTGKSVLHDLTDGLSYVRRNRTLVALLGLQLLPGLLLIGPFRVTAVAIVQDVLGQSDRYVGFLSGGFGIGTLGGSLVLTGLRLRRRGLILCASPIAGGLIFLIYGLSGSVWLSLAMMIPWGLSAAVHINMVTPLIQERSSPQMLGRVMSMSSLAFAISTPLGFAHSGLVSNFWSPEASVIMSGSIFAAIGLLSVLFLRPVRSLD